jgi:hypothetical protein
MDRPCLPHAAKWSFSKRLIVIGSADNVNPSQDRFGTVSERGARRGRCAAPARVFEAPPQSGADRPAATRDLGEFPDADGVPT